jgi:hypothetical protein
MLKLHFDISSVQLVGYGFMMAIPPLFLVDELLRTAAVPTRSTEHTARGPLGEAKKKLRAIPDITSCLF